MKLYQIFYDGNSKSKLLQGFIPYDNTNKCTKYFENDVIIDIQKNHRNEWLNEDLVGVVSWRFYEKTKLNYNLIQKVITPEIKIYLLTPIVYVMVDNSFASRGLHDVDRLCEEIDSSNVLDFKITNYSMQDCKNLCNFYLLSPEYFDLYVSDLVKVREFFETTNNVKARALLDKTYPYRTNITGLQYYTGVFLMDGLFCRWLYNKGYNYRYIFPDIKITNEKTRIFFEENKNKIIITK
jgi:hypothetical protein